MCNHDNIKPYVYGAFHPHLFDDMDKGFSYYGGMRKTIDSPDYFCPDCLEDIFIN